MTMWLRVSFFVKNFHVLEKSYRKVMDGKVDLSLRFRDEFSDPNQEFGTHVWRNPARFPLSFATENNVAATFLFS